MTVFKSAFFPYSASPLGLQEIDLHALVTFGKQQEALARAAFLSDYAAQPKAETKPATADLDTVAERILRAFKGEDDSLTDATLLAASGVGREAYLNVRDELLIETEEISELVDTIPTEYIRNWPRKTEAA